VKPFRSFIIKFTSPPRDQIWSRPTQSAHSYSLGAFAKLRKATNSFVTSVRLSARNSVPTGRIFMKCLCFIIFYLSRKFKFHSNRTRITGTWHQDRYTFLIITRSVLLRITNVSHKSCRGNQNTHFMFNNIFRKSCGKMLQNRAGHRWQYGAFALHVGYLRLQIHTHNM